MRPIKLTWACLAEVFSKVGPRGPVSRLGINLHLVYYLHVVTSVFEADTQSSLQPHTQIE